jgi:aminoglycoside phosphotransferase (APT) family kinase protein
MGHAPCQSVLAVPVAVLGVADVPGFLLERRLLVARDVVDGGLTVDDRSQLNRVFLVGAGGERRFVVKVGPAVAREAWVLERLRAVTGLSRALPRVATHDPAGRVLVLEAAPGARDLVRHHERGRFSCALAAEAGRSLARLHAAPPGTLTGVAPLRPSPPPHRPDLEMLWSLSAAATELVRIVQRREDVCAALDALLSRPAPVLAVVHGDVRWSNCIALRGRARGWTGLQLIDWERCDVGDPAADAGAFIGEYLRAWIGSMPVADARDVGALRGRAGIPLQRLRPAVGAFWSAYAGQRSGSPGATLSRALRFAGLRLLMAAFEAAQAAGELRPGVLALLPLSRNVLHRPDQAADLLELA